MFCVVYFGVSIFTGCNCLLCYFWSFVVVLYGGMNDASLVLRESKGFVTLYVLVIHSRRNIIGLLLGWGIARRQLILEMYWRQSLDLNLTVAMYLLRQSLYNKISKEIFLNSHSIKSFENTITLPRIPMHQQKSEEKKSYFLIKISWIFPAYFKGDVNFWQSFQN